VKGLHLYFGQEAWGHVIAQFSSELPEGVDIPPELCNKARVLDKFYFPTRYPNGHP